MVTNYAFNLPIPVSLMIIRWFCSNGPYLRASSAFMWAIRWLELIVNMQWWSFIMFMHYGWKCASLLFDSSLSLGLWVRMDLSTTSVLAAKAYKYKAESLVKEYLLVDSYVSYTAVLGGILMCKMVRIFPSYLLTLEIHE